MKASILAALGLAALAHAQGTLPACAQTCALNAIGSTGCQVTDAKCICTKPDFLSSVQTCIQGACSAADIAATLAYAQSFCLQGGVTITVPSASASATSAAASGSASSAPASTSAATSAAAPASSPAVSQISDGQPQAPTSQAAPATFTGAAAPLNKNLVVELLGLGVGVAAVL